MRNLYHAVFKRLGSTTTRQKIWDDEFLSGKWLSSQEKRKPFICDVISKYLPNGGTLLDLGCSNGIISWSQKDYGQYIGVDISNVAIEFAKERNQPNCIWNCADIATYDPGQNIDVILFRQSLYYLLKNEIRSCLKHYQRMLTPNGVIIVVMETPSRYEWIIDHISSNYEVIEEQIVGSIILVFK